MVTVDFEPDEQPPSTSVDNTTTSAARLTCLPGRGSCGAARRTGRPRARSPRDGAGSRGADPAAHVVPRRTRAPARESSAIAPTTTAVPRPRTDRRASVSYRRRTRRPRLDQSSEPRRRSHAGRRRSSPARSRRDDVRTAPRERAASRARRCIEAGRSENRCRPAASVPTAETAGRRRWESVSEGRQRSRGCTCKRSWPRERRPSRGEASHPGY